MRKVKKLAKLLAGGVVTFNRLPSPESCINTYVMLPNGNLLHLCTSVLLTSLTMFDHKVQNTLSQRHHKPFRVSSKFVTKNRDSVNRATSMKMLL